MLLSHFSYSHSPTHCLHPSTYRSCLDRSTFWYFLCFLLRPPTQDVICYLYFLMPLVCTGYKVRILLVDQYLAAHFVADSGEVGILQLVSMYTNIFPVAVNGFHHDRNKDLKHNWVHQFFGGLLFSIPPTSIYAFKSCMKHDLVHFSFEWGKFLRSVLIVSFIPHILLIWNTMSLCYYSEVRQVFIFILILSITYNFILYITLITFPPFIF